MQSGQDLSLSSGGQMIVGVSRRRHHRRHRDEEKSGRKNQWVNGSNGSMKPLVI